MVEHTITELENILGYSFKNRQILVNALTTGHFFMRIPTRLRIITKDSNSWATLCLDL